ncbi:MAG TPA: hypothetical protein VJH97_00825 [Candidatus Nanoarchaeia archaeon]|nr:hypothetical protein [Candidatus Nanoarchaeia archaeon]
MVALLEDELEKEKSSWSLIQSNFYSDEDYLNELGLDESLKKEIRNG